MLHQGINKEQGFNQGNEHGKQEYQTWQWQSKVIRKTLFLLTNVETPILLSSVIQVILLSLVI